MRRCAATVTLLCALIAPSTTAVAAPPSPSPAPSSGAGAPTQRDVERAKAAVAAAAARQAALEATLRANQDRLDDLDARAQLATEQYNESRVLLARRTAAAGAATRAAATAQRRAQTERGRVDSLAATAYMSGGAPSIFDTLYGLAAGPDVERNAADLEAISDYRAGTLRDARTAAAQAETARRAAAQAQVQQKAAAERSRTAYVAATNAVARAQVQEQQLEAQRAAALAELARLRRTSAAVEQARLDALAAASARAAVAQRSHGAQRAGIAGFDASSLPAADTDAAARAIAYAEQQLGKPYEWAADGPDTFDCSGLTMRAWEAGGRSLDHYTGSQYAQTARVPIDDLKPGDLVFFGADVASIHHVGLYVGDGTMIEAPHTGAVVRYSSIYRKSLLDVGGRP